MTAKEIGEKLEYLNTQKALLNQKKAQAMRNASEFEGMILADKKCLSGKGTKSAKKNCQANLNNHTASLNYYNSIIEGYKNEIVTIQSQIDVLEQNIITAQLTDSEVQTILANSGNTRESVVVRELQTGETNRFELETTTEARNAKINAEADAIAEQSDADAKKKKAIAIAGIAIGALLLIVAIVFIVKKAKKNGLRN